MSKNYYRTTDRWESGVESYTTADVIKGIKNKLVTILKILCFVYVVILVSNALTGMQDITLAQNGYSVPIITKANAEQKANEYEVDIVTAQSPENPSRSLNDNNLAVQAVLGAKRQIVLASGLDAKITKLSLESGDRFKKGDVLVEYDCSVDAARLNEVLSRQRVTEEQLNAYRKLADLDSASNIEVLIAKENNEQNKALISQIRGRLQFCKHIAPWDGRVTRKMASQYEYVQTGRVLMDISSLDPLRAEFLIPSRWLRWLNIGTGLNIYINETGQNYSANITHIFGEVDPVSQSIQVVAEMEEYHEELLPGMSGMASFNKSNTESGKNNGFLGLSFIRNEAEGEL